VSRVFVADTRAWRRNVLAAPAEIARLRSALGAFAPDFTLDLQGLWKSALVAQLARGPVFGFAAANRREPASAMLARHRIRPGPGVRHVVDLNLALAAAAGLPADGRAPDARYLLGVATPDGDAFLARLPRPFALYHPGAGRADKTWGEERFAQLARLLARERGLTPVVSWGPGDEERAAQLVRLLPEATAIPRLDFAGLARVVAAAALFVAGDTGPLHLADALGTRVVAIFGVTDPVRNGPYGQRQSVAGGGREASVQAVAEVARKALDGA
jgi:ADP-heptose:LPS heptosyltransferase